MIVKKLMHKEIQQFLTGHLGKRDLKLEPIKKGGSDRAFFRVILPKNNRYIFMHYGTEVEENSFWSGINDFLTRLGISVPRIIAQDTARRFILMEDLGDVDLYSQASAPWKIRREYYFQALTQIHRLHSFAVKSLPADVQLSESYGPRLYKWEHDYFLENLVCKVCKIKLSVFESQKLINELDALSEHLQKIKPCLIHRDFQSQNIMIKNRKPVFVDFQGMRRGNLFYDLGSLICDPYVKFTFEERNELLDFYYELTEPEYNRAEFVDNFWEAAAQRLMQALGAYGFLGLKKGKRKFLGHIDNGIKYLVLATSCMETLPALNELAQRCENILTNQ
jgi:aminoglycoside/choline kinase family phosphotransferase